MAVGRAVLIRYSVNGERKVGSGLWLCEAFVLTAAHCAEGTGHTVTFLDGVTLPDGVQVRSERADVDLATPVLKEAPPPGLLSNGARVFCQLLPGRGGPIQRCRDPRLCGPGYPRWRRDQRASESWPSWTGPFRPARGCAPRRAARRRRWTCWSSRAPARPSWPTHHERQYHRASPRGTASPASDHPWGETLSGVQPQVRPPRGNRVLGSTFPQVLGCSRQRGREFFIGGKEYLLSLEQ